MKHEREITHTEVEDEHEGNAALFMRHDVEPPGEACILDVSGVLQVGKVCLVDLLALPDRFAGMWCCLHAAPDLGQKSFMIVLCGNMSLINELPQGFSWYVNQRVTDLAPRMVGSWKMVKMSMY